MKKNVLNRFSNWVLYNAENQVLGRLASKIAVKLMGKDSIDYKSYSVSGSNVIVINAKKIIVTGNKLHKKKYYRHTGFPGGLKTELLVHLIERNSKFVIKNAVKGMLPKNKLQKIFLKNLRIYDYDYHPHIAQNPTLEG